MAKTKIYRCYTEKELQDALKKGATKEEIAKIPKATYYKYLNEMREANKRPEDVKMKPGTTAVRLDIDLSISTLHMRKSTLNSTLVPKHYWISSTDIL